VDPNVWTRAWERRGVEIETCLRLVQQLDRDTDRARHGVRRFLSGISGISQSLSIAEVEVVVRCSWLCALSTANLKNIALGSLLSSANQKAQIRRCSFTLINVTSSSSRTIDQWI